MASSKKENADRDAVSRSVVPTLLDSSSNEVGGGSDGGRHGVEERGNRTIVIDSATSSSRSSSLAENKPPPKLSQPVSKSGSPLASPGDPNGLHPAAPWGRGDRPVSKGPSMSDRVPWSRRPPHLDIGAVREAETRGSMTSLPDLIRRATRLAANLDRGRTASRTGLIENLTADNKEQRRRSGSISDILASFPPPSRGTPDGRHSISRWPSPFPQSKLQQHMSYLTSHDSESTRHSRRGKRCCGMSSCALITLLLLLAILVAAAVVVPVVLIVLPRQRHAAENANRLSGVVSCSDPRRCENGGVGVVSGDTCRCVCVNGFTGDRCSIDADPGCITADVGAEPDIVKAATMGNAIPRLLTGSSTNYQIPLNSSIILGLFSANNLSCTSENELVTFKDQNVKKRTGPPEPTANEVFLPFIPESPLPLESSPTRQKDLSFRLEPRQVATSNGIVYQMSATPPATPSSPLTSTSTTSRPPLRPLRTALGPRAASKAPRPSTSHV